MCKKGKAEKHLESYLGEIKNKLGIIPAFFHSDQGGEFSSTVFTNKLKSQGICTEKGPPNSPETNGVAEIFNQSLLTKVRCLFSQSNIPISYWDDAVNHASLLLNHLPQKFINMKSPMEILSINGINIEPTIRLERIIPFGMKVIVKTIANTSKLQETGESMRALTFEKYSDGFRVLDPKTGCIRISRDYATSSNEITTVVRQSEAQLPKAVNLNIILKTSKNKYPPSVSEEHLQNSIVKQEQIEPIPASVNQELVTNKHYQYVPYYKEPEKHISSSVSPDNIIEGKQIRKNPDKLFLTDLVPYTQAMKDPIEKDKWKEAMDQEFNLLMCHNTGILVPHPKNGEKVIGGMWCLNKKRNEFVEVYRYKARWVVFGNHQEHMLHFFDTWSSVGKNKTFKAMLSLLINHNMYAYQFDIETAFIHGTMDSIVYVKQVKGYEQLNRENWVWRLNKSLYGTQQAPIMWKEKLTEVLSQFGFASSSSDESLFITSNATLMLHIHVDDGFLIGKLEQEVMTFLTSLNKKLKLKFKKNPTQHLGYTIMWNKLKVQLSQTDLILKLLDPKHMKECKPVKTPCNGNFLQEIDSTKEPIKITEYH
ncbi:hypothetical protein O181_108922 [Austropuccinia psidii MF-1]|uniref:Integrase catalytic domain-containing protein n=1 Tax=Austropuccinia psidii MF-1 TaxID=1389203 RepID=A0A9Q3JWU8_9BASI|nr:hypothetical protein [Austropuccinia psidii MF-1]